MRKKTRKAISRKHKYLTIEQVSRLAQEAGLKSAVEYKRWVRDHGYNKAIPMDPIGAYLLEWESWPVFLNVKPKTLYDHLSAYRPYFEALRWVQPRMIEAGITTQIEYKRWLLNNEYDLPDDIPMRDPLGGYDAEWPRDIGMGWRLWFGVGAEERLEVVKLDVELIAFATSSFKPTNQLYILVAPNGKAEMIQKLSDSRLELVQCYKTDSERMGHLQQFMLDVGNKQDDGSFIVSNVPALLGEFSHFLEQVKLGT